MKKKLLVLTLILVLALTGCTSKKSLIDITYDELATKIENKDSFVLYVGSSKCSHCAEFEPNLEKVVVDYDLDVYYINMADLSESRYNAVLKKADTEGTPTLVYLEKGKTKTSPRIEGTRDYNATLEFFKDAGLVENEG